MIPVSEIRKSLEKNAGTVRSVAKYFLKHPWQAIIPTLAVGGALSIGRSIHPLHQMIREETKNKIIKDQRSILNSILNEQRKSNTPPKSNQKLIVRPLV